MSNYNTTAINPRTKLCETSTMLDDYFGKHKYGVRFGGEEEVYPEAMIEFLK